HRAKVNVCPAADVASGIVYRLKLGLVVALCAASRIYPANIHGRSRVLIQIGKLTYAHPGLPAPIHEQMNRQLRQLDLAVHVTKPSLHSKRSVRGDEID